MRLRFFVLPIWLTTSVTEHTEVANSVINFYTTSLSKYVGEAYQPPSLSYLANLWFQGSSELIRIILTSYISLTDPQTNYGKLSVLYLMQAYPLCQMRKPFQLSSTGNIMVRAFILITFSELRAFLLAPCLQLPSERESLTAALSLFVCGFIAAEKYSFISAPYDVFDPLSPSFVPETLSGCYEIFLNLSVSIFWMINRAIASLPLIFAPEDFMSGNIILTQWRSSAPSLRSQLLRAKTMSYLRTLVHRPGLLFCPLQPKTLNFSCQPWVWTFSPLLHLSIAGL